MKSGFKKIILMIGSLVLVLSFLSFEFPNKTHAIAYNAYRMIGGVGDYGANTRYYYVGNANTYQMNSSVAAMTKWVNSNGGLTYTPISFSKTTYRPDSVVDIMFSNLGNTGWYGLTDWYRGGTKITVSGAPSNNWSWSQININDYYYSAMLNYETNTERVVSHEIGHAFGLSHNTDSTSVMRDSWPQVLAPSKKDLDEITSMYP